MSTIVLGRGHLGRYLATQLETARFDDDIFVFRPRGGDVVISAVGKTSLEWCEAHPEHAYRVNAIGPTLLAHRCAHVGARLIVLSSGCVWDNSCRDDGKPFAPHDPPLPQNVYTWSKVVGDVGVRASMPTAAILRLRMPYSPVRSPRNLLHKLQGYPALIDDPNSVTSADTLVATVKHLLAEANSLLWGRISCVYDRGVTSPLAIGRMLAVAGLRAAPTLLAKDALDTFHKPKRVNTVMYDPVFEQAVDPPQVETELRRVIRLYARGAL